MLKLDGVSVDGKSVGSDNVTIVAFTGSFPLGEKDNFSFSQTIYDDERYSQNKTQCDNDFELFRNKVKEYAGKLK